MKKHKNGWVQGSVQEFLDLSDADMAYIETKRALTKALRTERQKQHVTQIELAKRMQTSQSRVAKIEAGDPTVSVDLILRALFTMGAKPKKLVALF